MDKPFLTYDEQIKHLVEDKKIKCDGPSSKIILCRNGYFNLINGYKMPFVCNYDKSTLKHSYYPGTTIEQIAMVKEFDDTLRMHLLKYITKAEEEVRTIVGYRFDDINFGKALWNDKSFYSRSLTDEKSVEEMISSATEEIDRSELDYITFYKGNHKYIPTWIFVKVINFSTFINFLDCCDDNLKDSMCQLYGMYDKDGNPYHKLLIGSLHWLRKVRNSCAHNERIYTISRENGRIKETYIMNMKKAYQRDRTQKLFDLLVYMKYYLDPESYAIFIKDIKEILISMEKMLSSNVFANIRAATGIKDVIDLDSLLLSPNRKQYI